MGNQNKEYPEDAFNYAFFNCLLNTPKTEEPDPRLVDCLWDIDDKAETGNDSTVVRDGNFLPQPDLDRLLFSFTLSPHSKAVGHANPDITALTYPADRLGKQRKTAPDIGCYETSQP
mgnify:FL=1